MPGSNAAPDAFAVYHSAAYQYAVADGAHGFYSVAKPAVATSDSHSLAELAVESSDGQQIVEIGWTVDRGLNGDDDPHLFAYHWVDGVGTCYNGCGFVPITFDDSGVAVGMTLPVSATDVQEFWVEHQFNVWYVGYNSHYVGYFPDSLWGGRFTKIGLTQWFGEVASAPISSPCSQMGNGGLAASTNAARIQNVGFSIGLAGGPTANITTSQTNSAYYTALRTDAASMSYGGQGACRTVPDVRGDNPGVLPNVLSAAGLVRGTVTAVPDALCEDLQRVISQSPAPGSRVSAGALVNVTYGVRPVTGRPPRQ